jgi:hypothetical protein
MTTDLSVACLRCGRPANPEHHQPPDRASKGMGGTSDPNVEDWRVPLCRDCHDSLHRQEWALRVEDGIATGFDLKGEMLFVRPYEPMEVALSFSSYPKDILMKRGLLTWLSDENLCYFIGRALVAAKTNVLNIGMAADVFRERYGQYGERWYERAAEIIRDNNQDGQGISARELYRCHAVYVAFSDKPELLELMSKTLAATCAEAAEPAKAIEFCVNAISEGHQPTVKLIEGKFGHKGSSLESAAWETCSACGGTGRVRVTE